MTERFSSVLVANRGEIALRIMKSARNLGYRTIAVASEADRRAPHADFADACVLIGASPTNESYLCSDKIIKAAKETGAEAIHPGYGFLSENAEFARSVVEAGLVFIGPSPEAIALMGDKAIAKRRMIDAGVPCIPGYQGTDQDDQRFVEAAERAGFPVMIKAAAGGGGRGMRLVHRIEDLQAGLDDARKEAEAAFGSRALILEKAVQRARHIEIQVLGDKYGSIIHLGERDCSLQRRHQKVIEEAPSPAVDEALRGKMGAAAVNAAKAVDYQGAGTVEFLLADDGAFYFLEMNTRLQVEHPVTEEVTGLDLVALQLAIAQGRPLEKTQDDIRLKGHAIEARLYAEDPSQNFLPSTGFIHLWNPPKDARVDAGIESGMEVTSFYDPMLAKIIATGETREDARRKLVKALEETTLLGLTTNRAFLRTLLEDQVFKTGQCRTDHIDGAGIATRDEASEQSIALCAVIQHLDAFKQVAENAALPEELAHWSSSEAYPKPYHYTLDGHDYQCTVCRRTDGFIVCVDQEKIGVDQIELTEDSGVAAIDGERVRFDFIIDGSKLFLSLPYTTLTVENALTSRERGTAEVSAGAVTAPMHGLVSSVFVEEGAKVRRGDRLALLEAMKMQHEISSPTDGTVSNVLAAAGKQVASGDTLVIVEPEEEQAS
ncbi:MAG: biotin carboxylase N-terminal domain-containing protein [Pseudomonadota bacterium]